MSLTPVVQARAVTPPEHGWRHRIGRSHRSHCRGRPRRSHRSRRRCRCWVRCFGSHPGPAQRGSSGIGDHLPSATRQPCSRSPIRRRTSYEAVPLRRIGRYPPPALGLRTAQGMRRRLRATHLIRMPTAAIPYPYPYVYAYPAPLRVRLPVLLRTLRPLEISCNSRSLADPISGAQHASEMGLVALK